jgi:site-specific DNA-methyltransferase (adenine-specific)
MSTASVVPADPSTRAADIVITDDRIIHGDCTQILTTLPDESVDLVLTDPPYLVRYRDRSGRTIANDDRPESVLGAFSHLYRVLRPDSFCISFCGWHHVDAFFQAWKGAGFTPVGHIVWCKDYVRHEACVANL